MIGRAVEGVRGGVVVDLEGLFDANALNRHVGCALRMFAALGQQVEGQRRQGHVEMHTPVVLLADLPIVDVEGLFVLRVGVGIVVGVSGWVIEQPNDARRIGRVVGHDLLTHGVAFVVNDEALGVAGLATSRIGPDLGGHPEDV